MMPMVLFSIALSIALKEAGLPLGFSFEVALLIYASAVLFLSLSNSKGVGSHRVFYFSIIFMVAMANKLLMKQSDVGHGSIDFAIFFFFCLFISIVGGILSGLATGLVGHTGTYASAALVMVSSLFALRLTFLNDHQATSNLAITRSRRQ
ncbi:MAG: hypothetical protein AAGA73_21395 [Pseudomonadota bacterium]